MSIKSGLYRNIDGLHFIKTYGTFSEQSEQHAALLKNIVHQGALNALAKKNEWLIRRGGVPLEIKWIQNLAVSAYKNILIPILLRSLSRGNPEYKLTLQKFCKTAEIDFRIPLGALLQPDALMLLSRFSVMQYLFKEFGVEGLPGCTSAVVLKEWTQDGKPLVCRNMDYPIVGPWEANTTVIFSEPTESDRIPHVSITTAGVHTSGLTSMNREGLTLNLHAHFGRKVSLSGIPIMVIGSEIISRAHNLDEAVDIANSLPRIGNWAYVMTSAKENRAIIIEMTPKELMVYESDDGFLSHSNFFHNEPLHETEAMVSGGRVHDEHCRLSRPRDMLIPKRGQVTPEDMCKILGDQFDQATGETRIFGNTVSVPTTVKSVVFSPEDQKLWISTKNQSPVGHGRFLEINANQLFQDETWQGNFFQKEYLHNYIQGTELKDDNLKSAIGFYREAYIQYHMNSHEPDFREKTLSWIRKILPLYPNDAHIWLQAGLLAFRIGEFDSSLKYFETSSKMKLTAHLHLVADLFMARIFDLRELRFRALQLYTGYKKARDPRLKKAMKKGMKKAYRQNDRISMLIDLQYADVHQY